MKLLFWGTDQKFFLKISSVDMRQYFDKRGLLVLILCSTLVILCSIPLSVNFDSNLRSAILLLYL